METYDELVAVIRDLRLTKLNEALLWSAMNAYISACIDRAIDIHESGG